MKATEVRIGNLLNHNNGFVVGPFTVNSIHISDLERDNAYAKEYEPIPLTEEWLISFGFIDDKITFELKGFMLGWYRNDEFYYLPTNQINVRNKIQIKYVHQLQNLYFALTGEELGLQDT
jgi:hypothetical protein